MQAYVFVCTKCKLITNTCNETEKKEMLFFFFQKAPLENSRSRRWRSEKKKNFKESYQHTRTLYTGYNPMRTYPFIVTPREGLYNRGVELEIHLPICAVFYSTLKNVSLLLYIFFLALHTNMLRTVLSI